MCGIAGIIGTKEYTENKIDHMVDIISHRGPDDRGVLIESSFAFGMRRLSIIDLSGGHQPISNEDDTVTIVFNGEIYNHRELRPTLISLGHQFKTESDTEVLVHMYEQYGFDMLKKLRGMFAFAIFDKNKNQIFIARDFFGIKPLYYRVQNGKIQSFGSEIKSLLDSTLKIGTGENISAPKINESAVYNYFSFQYNPLEETMFEGIFKLLPGHYMTINLSDETYSIEPYWHYQFNHKQEWPSETNEDEDSLAEEIKKVVEDSVEHHLISDVPVGSFLSGGVDSGIIVSTLQNLRKKSGSSSVSTFTIGFDHVSEQAEARQMATAVNSDHHEIKIEFDEYFKELSKISWHFDEPVADPSAVALYFLAREARKKVKVVLSGEGADELFGGYNIYREPFDTAYISKFPNFIKKYFIYPLLLLPFNFYGKNYIRRSTTKLEDRYIGNAYIFKKPDQNKLWKKLNSNRPNSDKLKLIDMSPYYNSVKGETDSRKMQYIDIQFWLPGDILAKADKMTMAHSLELRVPFLDIEVGKLSSRIPDKYKYKNGKTKYILRKAFEKVLPKETSERKKLGFPTPMAKWLKEKPEEVMKIILENEYVKENFNKDYIKKLAEDHLIGHVDNARKIYALLMFVLWYNIYIKNSNEKLTSATTNKISK